MVMKKQENKGKGRPLVWGFSLGWVLDEVWCGDGKCDLWTDQSQLRLLLKEVVQIGLRAEMMRGWQGKRKENVGWVGFLLIGLSYARMKV